MQLLCLDESNSSSIKFARYGLFYLKLPLMSYTELC